MASCSTPQWSNSSTPYVQLDVTQSSSTGDTVTLSWVLKYIAKSEARTNGLGRTYSVTIDGVSVKSGTFDINRKVGTYTVASGTKTVNKSNLSRNVSFSTSFTFDVTWSGVYGGTKSASGSIGIGAKTSYIVSYNANGGSGAPGSQTKWYGTSLVLTSAIPTRTGYEFLGWGDSASSTTPSAQPGATYTANASKTYYAIWRAHTYIVSYNANGGSGAPGSQTKTYGVTLKLSATKPTRANYNFLGWGTSAASSTVAYAAGANYTTNAAITLYAIWQLAYTPPRITGITVERCTSDGTADENGTYAHVIFSWVCDKSVSSIQVRWKADTLSSDYQSISIAASGTSGKVNKVIGSGKLSTENGYTIEAIVSDSVGSSTYGTSIAGIAYIIDVRAGGKGIAFGKPADTDNLVDVNYDLKLRKMLKGNVTTNDRFIRNTDAGGSWIGARNIATLTNKGTPGSTDSFYPILSCKTLNGSWNIGTLGESLAFSYDTDSNVSSNNNTSKVTWFYSDGSVSCASGHIRRTDIMKDSPLVGDWGFQIASNGWTGTHDKYFLGVNSSGEVHSGIQLNGAKDITARRLAFADEVTQTKVLWSGASYMTAGHIIKLRENISSQKNGIALMFSYYNGSAPVQSDFSCFFVPKNFVTYSGTDGGISFNCSDHWFHAMKYLYITDGQIKGHDWNGTTRSSGGISYENAKVVLRYVFGV